MEHPIDRHEFISHLAKKTHEPFLNEKVQGQDKPKRCHFSKHIWKKIPDRKEMCKTCGAVILDRKVSSALYKSRLSRVSRAVNASLHLENLRPFARYAKKIFKEDSESAKVANIIYYLRYSLGYDPQKIEFRANMSPMSLNWYIINYPWRPGCS